MFDQAVASTFKKHLALSLAGRRHHNTSHTDAAEKEIKDRGERWKTAASGDMSVAVATWAGAHRGQFWEESCSDVIDLDLRLTELQPIGWRPAESNSG